MWSEEWEGQHTCHSVSLEVRGHLARDSSLFPLRGFWGLNSACRLGGKGLYPLSSLASLFLLFVCLLFFLAAPVWVGVASNLPFTRLPVSEDIGCFMWVNVANSPLAGKQRASQRIAVFLPVLLCLLWNTTTESCDFQSVLFWKTGSPTSPTLGKTVFCCQPK